MACSHGCSYFVAPRSTACACWILVRSRRAVPGEILPAFSSRDTAAEHWDSTSLAVLLLPLCRSLIAELTCWPVCIGKLESPVRSLVFCRSVAVTVAAIDSPYVPTIAIFKLAIWPEAFEIVIAVIAAPVIVSDLHGIPTEPPLILNDTDWSETIESASTVVNPPRGTARSVAPLATSMYCI